MFRLTVRNFCLPSVKLGYVNWSFLVIFLFDVVILSISGKCLWALLFVSCTMYCIRVSPKTVFAFFSKFCNNFSVFLCVNYEMFYRRIAFSFPTTNFILMFFFFLLYQNTKEKINNFLFFICLTFVFFVLLKARRTIQYKYHLVPFSKFLFCCFILLCFAFHCVFLVTRKKGNSLIFCVGSLDSQFFLHKHEKRNRDQRNSYFSADEDESIDFGDMTDLYLIYLLKI